MASLHEALQAAVEHWQTGRAEEAGILLDRILGVWPEQPDALHLQGVLLGQGGRIADAADRFERALAQRPESPDCQLNLARALRALGQGERAVAAYRTALALAPGPAAAGELADALVALGQEAEGQGRAAAAEAAYREALGLRPDDATALFHLGGVLQDFGRRDEARAALDAALGVAPDLVSARINRALLRAAAGDPGGALDDWRAALASAPAHPRALAEIAGALAAAGQVAQGLAATDRAIALCGETGALLAARARFLLALGRDAEAENAKYRAMWAVDAYRVVSPGQEQARRFDLAGLLRPYGVRTILDAGCGSGKTSQYIMTSAPGEFEVFGFDIAENCLDPFFDAIKDRYLTVGCLWRRDDFPRDYDAVVCTDVLEHIPPDKVPAVLSNLRAVCRRVAYLGIALFADGFGPQELGEPLHLTVEPPDWWLDRLRDAGFQVVEATTDVDAAGKPAWLYALLLPAAGGR
ncbi:tetratricopeptide repeat protein [Azospirillum sp. ST 5-10]|uniref:tetratricopeptide repeat protein n=1 Tax=unclassified Azospirillum TaxID=2630922 RepID=UPI003F4A0A16